jgi:hypothetical protein
MLCYSAVMVSKQSSEQRHSVDLHLRFASYAWLDSVVLVGQCRRPPLPRGGCSLTYCLALLVGRRLPVHASIFPLIVVWSEHVVQ